MDCSLKSIVDEDEGVCRNSNPSPIIMADFVG